MRSRGTWSLAIAMAAWSAVAVAGGAPDPADRSGGSAGPTGGTADRSGGSAGPMSGSSDQAGDAAGRSGDPAGPSVGSGTPSGGSRDSSGGAAGPGPRPPQIVKVPVEAGAPQVNAAASPTVVSLGAHFTLYLTATFEPGVEVNLREPLDLGPAFEVRRRLSEDHHAADGRTTREWQVDVTPWELGDQQVAPVAITFTAYGHAGQIATNAVPLRVIGTLGEVGEDTRLRGLALPRGLAMRDWLWIWIAAAAGAVVGALAVALWLRRRRRRRRHAVQLIGGVAVRPQRIDMTGERALERLLAIERSGVLDRDGERKAGYAEMVEVIRDYLAARYRISTHDRTSAELVRELGRVAAEEQGRIAAWLEDCDLVRYGGERASPAEAGKVLDDARALIVVTTEPRGGGARAVPEAA